MIKLALIKNGHVRIKITALIKNGSFGVTIFQNMPSFYFDCDPDCDPDPDTDPDTDYRNKLSKSFKEV